jgi:hypothetical protein
MHNRFEISVIDADTKQELQRAVAENVVVDRIFSLICSNYRSTNYYRYGIQVGSGAGVPATTDVALFNRLASYNLSQAQHTIEPDLMTIVGSITIGNTDLVGAIITEVGFALLEIGESFTLFSHAMLKDSEGNPTSIGPKTNTQVITITAIFYVERPSGMVPFPNDFSHWMQPSMSYNGWIQVSSKNGSGLYDPNFEYPVKPILAMWSPGISGKGFGSAGNVGNIDLGSWNAQKIYDYGTNTTDNPFKTVDILGIMYRVLSPEFAIWFPNTDMFPGYTFVERVIGTGDGSKRFFNFDSGYFIEGSEVVKINGQVQTAGVDYIRHQGARQILNYQNYQYPYGTKLSPLAYQTAADKSTPVLMGTINAANDDSTFPVAQRGWGLSPSAVSYMLVDLQDIKTIGWMHFCTTSSSNISNATLQYSDDGITWSEPILYSGPRLVDALLGISARYIWIGGVGLYGIYFFGPSNIEFLNPPPLDAEIKASWSTEVPPKNANLFYTMQVSLTIE